jgi:hypothetical protein
MKINNGASQGEMPLVRATPFPMPTPRGVSSQPDALHSYVKAEQHCGVVGAVSCVFDAIRRCMYKVFDVVVCGTLWFCCYRNKEETKIDNEHVIIQSFKDLKSKDDFLDCVEKIYNHSDRVELFKALVIYVVEEQLANKISLAEFLADEQASLALLAFTRAYLRFALEKREGGISGEEMVKFLFETNSVLLNYAILNKPSVEERFSLEEIETLQGYFTKFVEESSKKTGLPIF